MNLADLCNTKAVKLLGQSCQPYIDVLGNQVSGFQEKRVGASDSGNCRSSDQNRLKNFLRVSNSGRIRSLALRFRIQ
jgi:hypothetical protein